MKNLITLIALLLLATACAPAAVKQPDTADIYLKKGEEAFEKGRYNEAITNWEKIRDSYYSPEMNALAEMKIADAYYQGERYIEAAAAFEDFLRQHPSHTRTSDILYKLGMSYYHQLLSPDRDQTSTRNALTAFNDLLARFPDHPQNAEVKESIHTCLDQLAESEIMVGSFYLRTKKYEAAITRLQDVLEKHPSYSKRDLAYFNLGQAYLAISEKRRAAEAFNVLYHDFPDSEYIDKAQKLVEKSF